LQLFERGQEWTEKLMALQKKINSWREELNARLKAIDTEWEENRDSKPEEHGKLLGLLEKHCQLLGYFGRWSAQVQERIVQLSI